MLLKLSMQLEEVRLIIYMHYYAVWSKWSAYMCIKALDRNPVWRLLAACTRCHSKRIGLTPLYGAWWPVLHSVHLLQSTIDAFDQWSCALYLSPTAHVDDEYQWKAVGDVTCNLQRDFLLVTDGNTINLPPILYRSKLWMIIGQIGLFASDMGMQRSIVRDDSCEYRHIGKTRFFGLHICRRKWWCICQTMKWHWHDSIVITALQWMQTQSSDEKAVRPSIRPSVRRLSNVWIVTKRKKNRSRFLYHTKDH